MQTAPGGSPWPLDQIQGFLLRGYRMSFARHFTLTVANLTAARTFVANLTDPAIAGFQLTSAIPWGERPPEHCLNLGFTYAGLEKFAIPAADLAVLQTDPNYSAFAIGATTRAAALAETRPADPPWILDDRQFHVLLSIWANDEDILDARTSELKAAMAAGFAPLGDDDIVETQALDNGMVYFGYQDGIAQPIIQGTPFSRQPDGGQNLVDPSTLMIGTGVKRGIYQAEPFSVQLYGCFGAFMVIRQDVEAFDTQVAAVAPQLAATMNVTDPDVQKLAVKAVYCGRWPDGTPLETFPINGNDCPQSPPPAQKINDFNYGANAGMDPGTICPVGAHIRRGNMRVNAGDDGGAFQGVPSSSHRILRRAMPYQKPYLKDDRHAPQTERGLAGLFLGTSLLQQFELVYGSWINAQFAADMTLADPVIGVPDPSAVELPTASLLETIGPVKSCVTVKANAYLFYPGIGSIRTIVRGSGAIGDAKRAAH